MQVASPTGVTGGLAAIAILGLAGTAIGALLIRRMLDRLRREGTIGLA